MNGILVLNKPTGYSSHDCVNIVRRAFNTKKVGHAGTLDKEASGVLVLGVNRGTKIMEFLNQDDKGYMFTARFNQTTTTLDHTGEVVNKAAQHDFNALDSALNHFLGTYMQTPPAYSAVKVDGRKLYEYARKGQPIPYVPPRKTYIYTLKRLSDVRDNDDGTYSVDLFTETSKGVFVRSLADDIARKLASVGHTTRIHRTQSGRFSIEMATELSELKEGKYRLISMAEALEDYPEFKVAPSMIKKVQNGQPLKLPTEAPYVKLVDNTRALIGIYMSAEDGVHRPKRVFN